MKKEILRLSISIRGLVQGVGFRPFIYNLAKNLKLTGTVLNNSQGVFIEVEGEKSLLSLFLKKIHIEKPSISYIQNIESSFLEPKGFLDFTILKSTDTKSKTALVLPDISTCPKCVDEIFDPLNRRYLYPFTNCTLCGPRFSIIENLPYDRENTSMKSFTMCHACKEEYYNPSNRRFHAQPNACSNCGPELKLFDNSKKLISSKEKALIDTIDALKSGKIIAIKGIGGYQLICDASNEKVVSLLRKRKHRPQKPFALMSPTFSKIEEICNVTQAEKELVSSPQSPIVLLEKKNSSIFQNVSPNNPYLGVMLPYSPLHHIILKNFDNFIIATSGNLSEEPICIDENSAFERLINIADLFLTHNRPIVRQVDDSIARVINNLEQIQRRARGYSPLPVFSNIKTSNILSTGSHLKNSFSFTINNNLFLSQHIGDLDSIHTLTAFKREISSLSKIFDFKPELIACDKHPDYESSKWAKQNSKNIVKIGHHISHVYSCMAENELEAPILGVSWDGTGLGDDGTIWGGEFFHIRENSQKRVAHIKPFKLPGGEASIKEPRRSALGVLWEIYGEDLFSSKKYLIENYFSIPELTNLKRMLEKNLNSPVCSSMGRLFDAIGSILNLCQINTFEGQAAMALEFSVEKTITDEQYDFKINEHKNVLVLDWQEMVKQIIEDMRNITVPKISTKYHNTLSQMILTVARIINEKRIALSGGCFQNKVLTEATIQKLEKENFKVFIHQRVPPNDGGISVGQAYGVSNLNLKG